MGTHVFYFYFLDISLSIDIIFKDGVSKFLAQVHMRPDFHTVWFVTNGRDLVMIQDAVTH